MRDFVQGHQRFRADVFPNHAGLFAQLESQQHPQALFITCADSRIVPNVLLQADPGDLFVCRNAGNIVPPYALAENGAAEGTGATIEFAVTALAVEHIVICGHSDCGAMKAVASRADLEATPAVAAWLQHSQAALMTAEQERLALEDDDGFLRAVTRANVVQQLRHLRTHPAVAAQLEAGKLALHGWVYSIPTGAIEAFNAQTGNFSNLDLQHISVAG